MKTLDVASFALLLGMAAAAGLIGCFALMRRMSLAADAMSHVALPGIGIALILHMSPLVGAIAMLLVGALLIWALEQRTRIATETVTGVVFSMALAVGSLLASGEELIDALLGGTSTVAAWELALGIAAAAAVIVFIVRARNSLLVSLVSPEIAMTSGVDVARLDLYFLLAFALTVGLGLRYLGVLLMGSMIIIPPAVARRFARNLNGMFAWSIAVAVLSTAAGTYAAALVGRQSGPFIVMIAGGLFGVSLLRRQGA
ncbi:MAG TPA: metal ABC transporter permease [Gammaproteobacteria bacterium]|nr:metal ABC transporter permease [Gammaproteobacteria bacterium]